MELHQVPGRPPRQRHRALRAQRRARSHRRRHRKAAVTHTVRRVVAFALAFVAALGCVAAADLNKTLRVAFPIAETGFDPQAVGDVYSQYVNRVIFDPLYRYDYLARPYKIVPNTATAMPEISSDGKTWIMHVRPGIYFSDDPAFNGKKRELVAADYVYAWKRIIDPRARSNNVAVFDGKLVGADKVVAAGKC